MDTFLQLLRRHYAIRDLGEPGQRDLVQTETIGRQAPRFASSDVLSGLPPFLQEGLSRLGIEELYEHQATAIEKIRGGQDVVIESPTASGKTLAFNVPLVWRLCESRTSHAMMVHPMKALSVDQRRQVQDLCEVVSPAVGRDIDSWTYDGDTLAEHKKMLRQHPPAVIFTNPEYLNYSFLQFFEKHSRLLKNLEILVLDEIHEYRGFFGANMALLMRRFLAKLESVGVRPQLVLATATCANAKEHAWRITGRDCELISASGVMRPERKFYFVEPMIPDHRYTDIIQVRLANTAMACMEEKLSTLVFCPTRRFAEEAAEKSRFEAERLGRDDAHKIVAYRSGIAAQERRRIEDGLRDGSVRVAFTTNALEIGIDIGKLDCCVLVGFPDNTMSAWQRIGRTGRNWKNVAHVLYFALNNPHDKFFANNLEAFLDKPLDEILIGLDNQEVMRRHFPFSCYELGGDFESQPAESLGSPFLQYCRDRIRGNRPSRSKPPYLSLEIRGSSGPIYKLKLGEKEIGEISEVHRFREAYIGAVYIHAGRRYVVDAHGASEVYLVPASDGIRTEGNFHTIISEDDFTPISGRAWPGDVEAVYGDISIWENFTGYQEIDAKSGSVLGERDGSASMNRRARGLWLTFHAPELLGALTLDGTLNGLAQLLVIGTPFVLSCDRHDFTVHVRSGGQRAEVIFYETVAGGIGIAEKAAEIWPDILEVGMQIARRCRCSNGCPGCIEPTWRRSGQASPKKDPTLRAAEILHVLGNRQHREELDGDGNMWVAVQ